MPHSHRRRLPLLACLMACTAIAACGDDSAQNKVFDAPQAVKAKPHPRADSGPAPKAPITLDAASGKCFDVQDGNRAVGTQVILNNCNGAVNQQFAYQGGMLNVYLHKCLEVAGNIDQVGSKVVINWCDPNNKYQQWTRQGRSWMWTYGGKCIDVPAANPVNGAQLQIWSCNNTVAQSWSDATLPAVPPPPPPQPSPAASMLPQVKGTCPPLQTGVQTFNGQKMQLWAATAPQANSSLVFVWHGTGGSSNDATWIFGQNQINDVVAKGGVVASFASSTGTGANLNGNHVWFGDDFYTADQVVACAIRDLHIDPRRIYSTGASAGGLATTWMSYARSGYIAAVAPLSGGMLGQSYGNWGDPTTSMQDPTNVPFAMVTHGGKGVDVYTPTHFDFAVSSGLYEQNIASKGGMSIDCNTGGGHVSGPPVIEPFIWQFMQAHPYKQTPEPYQGTIPAGFPSYCKMGPVTY